MTRKSARLQKKVAPTLSLRQRRKSIIAGRLITTWPVRHTSRKNDDSRGVTNLTNHCYQNSTLQSFMHMPAFLNWIKTHSWCTPATAHSCGRCLLRDFAEQYWNSNPQNPMPRNPYDITQQLNDLACHSGNFENNAQEDSNEFYNWILGHLDTGTQPWREEFDALFNLDIQERKTCGNCKKSRLSANSSGTEITLTLDQGCKTIEDAIEKEFQYKRSGRCTISHSCKQKPKGQTVAPDYEHDVTKSITGAPLILRIHLAIYDHYGQKIFHHMSFNDILDLSIWNADIAPLKYQLSSVVGHMGNIINAGHYVANVRTNNDSRGPFRYFSDARSVTINQASFTGNPLQASQSTSPAEAYILTYRKIENDNVDITQKMARELKKLAPSEGWVVMTRHILLSGGYTQGFSSEIFEI
ncbi:cysteine proteinase [Corynespora cassiicola Philippines]|uniref:Cysteine proteinase n=1 Tax=Corynespora cassiicola Philippines TaxID=1448308 RepID=A0A2T2NR03_CORCC|nr:cysteine proteinase [Corynespora cassiicola Philippines]